MSYQIWFARSRPNGGTLPIAFMRCAHCGRGLYMTLREHEWGAQFCRGCDEAERSCWCPDARAVAA